MNEILRQEVKELKFRKDINYKEVAVMLGIQPNSFYNWLKNQYDFSVERQAELKALIEKLK